MFRYIDDLTVIDDDGEFEKVYHEIYPPELELKRANSSDKEASFSDLDIKIYYKRFSVSFYDKRDYFSCSIVRMTYLSSNMPSKLFRAPLGAEIITTD